MATINSNQELVNYCLRRLGQPVINIEIDNNQALERVNDAVQFFIERHYAGNEDVFLKTPITRKHVEQGYIDIPTNFIAISDILSASPFYFEKKFDYAWQMMANVSDVLLRNRDTSMSLSNYYISMSYYNSLARFLQSSNDFTYNPVTQRLHPRWNWSDIGSSDLLNNADVTTADWFKTNVSAVNNVADPQNGTNAYEIVSSAPNVFSIEQTIDTKGYIRGTYTFDFVLKSGTNSGNVTVTISDTNGVVSTQTFTPSATFTNHYVIATYGLTNTENLTVKIEATATAAGDSFIIYKPFLYKNAFLIAHGYEAVDGTKTTNVYNNRWVKDYATALIKKQWGTNIKKFDNVQLPGGVTMNGQEIYNEAVEEINALLEQFTEDYEEIPIGGWF